MAYWRSAQVPPATTSGQVGRLNSRGSQLAEERKKWGAPSSKTDSFFRSATSLDTPQPVSRERPTLKGMDARAVAPVRNQLGKAALIRSVDFSPAGAPSSETVVPERQRARTLPGSAPPPPPAIELEEIEAGPPIRDDARELITEPAGPRESVSQDSGPAGPRDSGPAGPRDSGPAGPRDGGSSQLTERLSGLREQRGAERGGFYSFRPNETPTETDLIEAVSIPRAPRLPRIDGVSPASWSSPASPTEVPFELEPLSSKEAHASKEAHVFSEKYAQRAGDLYRRGGNGSSEGAVPVRRSTPADFKRQSSRPAGRTNSSTNDGSQRASGAQSPSPTRSSLGPTAAARLTSVRPRVFFAAHLRTQAKDWLKTGSLSLPGCSSPRHARAFQRALLLAMLHEPGWAALPLGLQQRAGWLFCEAWEIESEAGRSGRELDDLLTVLSLPCSAESRNNLMLVVSSIVQEPGPPRTRSRSEAPPSS